MSPLSFRQRLWVLVVLVFLLLTVLGAVGWHDSQRVRRELSAIHDGSVLPLEKLTRLIDGMHQIRAQALFAASEETEAGAAAQLDRIKPLDRHFDDSWQALRATLHDPQARAIGDAFEARWAEYRKARDQSVQQIAIGDLASALHNMKHQAGTRFTAAGEQLDRLAARQARFAEEAFQAAGEAQRASAWKLGVVFAAGLGCFAVAVFWLFRSTARELGGEPHQAAALVRQVASGNLNLEINLRPGHEGSLLGAVKGMAAELSGMLSVIDKSGRQMGHASHQIASMAEEIAQVSESERDRSAAVVEVAEQVRGAAEQVHSLALAAVERAVTTEAQAQGGIALVDKTIQSMKSMVGEVGGASTQIGHLNSSAREIHRIIDTIRSIADQTNMLALNAAIESARAGEAGRGFAVVSDEVRQLAARTGIATGEIGGIISALGQQVEQITEAMHALVERVQAGEQDLLAAARVIHEMSGAVSETAAANRAISDASEGQTGQVLLLRDRLERLFAVFAQNTSKVEVTADISDRLFHTAGQLNALMDRFVYVHSPEPESAPVGERRRAPRSRDSLRVTISLPDGRSSEGLTGDISTTGLHLLCRERFAKGDRLALSIYTPGDDLDAYKRQQPLQIAGRVVWVREEKRGRACGVEFEAVSAQQKSRLDACVDYFQPGGRG